MECAANNGHFNCVRWLHENSAGKVTYSAMDNAASFGDLECVKFLHQNRTKGSSCEAMDRAATCGHFDVLVWLNENRTERFTPGVGTLSDVIENTGQQEIFEWLYNHQELDSEDFQQIIELSVCIGTNDIFKFLHSQNREYDGKDFIEHATKNSDLVMGNSSMKME
ncbi:hypothetical protein PPL_11652 [Heterostelium album PN500]|uniref:Uncharacterized protein n=1 Tax=Heterostelium pallidum (strain ATCC 26659 / Pp 5 / PN500) TaxID=670386 RepID=D3BVC6_HETP5|nr:hypothetical protein PPL_11652 [Heterostelium album PN500]EFA74683.1 hypothetical protein PPL_11652 [Heterostelium album PN500]|eukprot:XP_020426817.1 hypothetical protein PPL_11652 [Heterostelium album PN500]